MLEGNPEWSYYELYQGIKWVDGEPVYDYIPTFYRFYLDGQKEINGKTYQCIYMQTKERDEEMTAPEIATQCARKQEKSMPTTTSLSATNGFRGLCHTKSLQTAKL